MLVIKKTDFIKFIRNYNAKKYHLLYKIKPRKPEWLFRMFKPYFIIRDTDFVPHTRNQPIFRKPLTKEHFDNSFEIAVMEASFKTAVRKLLLKLHLISHNNKKIRFFFLSPWSLHLTLFCYHLDYHSIN